MKFKFLLGFFSLLALKSAYAMDSMDKDEKGIGRPEFSHVVKAFKKNEPIEIKGIKCEILREEDQPTVGCGSYAPWLRGGYQYTTLSNPCYEGEFDRLGFAPGLLHIEAVRNLPENVDFDLYDIVSDPYKNYFTLRYCRPPG